MQNKPNFQNVQMAVNAVMTMTNNNEPRTMNYAKQSQFIPTEGGTNPILRFIFWQINVELSSAAGHQVKL